MAQNYKDEKVTKNVKMSHKKCTDDREITGRHKNAENYTKKYRENSKTSQVQDDTLMLSQR